MTSLLYAFSISISVYAITYISHIAKSSVCHIYTALCFLLPCLICYFSQMKEPTYIILVVYISRIFLSELFIRFLHYLMLEYLHGFPSFLIGHSVKEIYYHHPTTKFCYKNSSLANWLIFGLNIPIPEILNCSMC